MKSLLILQFVLLASCCFTQTRQGNCKLGHQHPAQEWKEALPLGNERLGSNTEEFEIKASEEITMDQRLIKYNSIKI